MRFAHTYLRTPRVSQSRIRLSLLIGGTLLYPPARGVTIQDVAHRTASSVSGVARSDSARDSMITTVPFEIANGLVIVPAEVGGQSGKFLLDYGSSTNVLSSAYYPKATNPGHVQTFTLRVGTLQYVVDTASVHPQALFKIDFIMAPMPPMMLNLLEGQTNQSMGGVLGVSAWANVECILDYQRNLMTLVRVDSAGRHLAAVQGYTPIDSIPLVPPEGPVLNEPSVHQYLYVKTRVRDSTVLMMLDTGAPDNYFPEDLMRKTDTGFVMDSISVGNQQYTHMTGTPTGSVPMLGYPFYLQAGVVGFNVRGKKLMIYKKN